MIRLETGRERDDELITRSVLEAIESLERYVAALYWVYKNNLYEDNWGPEMQEHYVRCRRVLEDLKLWELCPHVLG